MFKCEKCECTTKSKEKENKIIISKRNKNYVTNHKDKSIEKIRRIESSGWEIVKEISVCGECYNDNKI